MDENKNEQLKRAFDEVDERMVIISCKSWIAILALGFICLSLLIWAFFGTITTTAYGNGISLSVGGVLNIPSKLKGRVSKIHVKKGDHIFEGTPIANIYDYELEIGLKTAIEQRDSLKKDLAGFRRQVLAILQTTKIFAGSILENILVGRKAKVEEVTKALYLSSFDQSLKELPLGYSTPLPVGGKVLSDGQRQRLLLARALLKEPKVLYLDEATSAIDTKSEMEIMDRLLKLKMTICFVTHQPLLLEKADVIIRMKDGELVSYECVKK